MTQQNKMTILVTGGAGFIGSNFIEYFLSQYSYINIINLDLLTYAADMKNLDSIINNPNHSFIQGDINDKNLLENLFDKYKFQAIIHFAAESHVDNSITVPDIFITTNVNGTLNLLDVAYKFWFQSPFVPKKGFYNTLFHHISTDEVMSISIILAPLLRSLQYDVEFVYLLPCELPVVHQCGHHESYASAINPV